MIECHWCGSEFEDKELCVLDINLPNCTEAYIRITNRLCPDCQGKVLRALGTLELEIKAAIGV